MKNRLFGLLLLVAFAFLPAQFALGEEARLGLDALTPFLPKLSALPAGWKMEASPEWFNGETLHKRLDGGAERYLDYGFKQLAVARYVPEATDANPNSVVVSVYDMGTKEGSFGIYSTLRSPQAEYVTIGAQGIVGDYALNFWQRSYYVNVEVSNPNSRNILTRIGDEMARSIGADPERLPHILNFMIPEPGELRYKARSLGLTAKKLFELDFLNWGYTSTYTFGREEITFFILDKAAPDQAKTVFDQYKKYYGDKKITVESTDLGDASFIARPEKTSAVWVVLKGNFVFGVQQVPDKEKCQVLLQKTAEKMGTSK